MIGQFGYNGIHSSQYGVYFRSINRPLLPSMRSKLVVIKGVNGSYDFFDNVYDNLQIKIKIFYIPDSYIERKQRAREIASWLSTNSWQKLILGDETDKYYLSRIYEGVDLDSFMASGEADITFECQPFAYAVDFNSYVFNAAGNMNYVFSNPGTCEVGYKSPQGSKFDIVITGTFTTLSLAMNGKVLNYTESVSNGVVTVDNVNMEVDLGGVNKLSKVTGDLGTFLKVIPGENSLSVSGTGLNVSIKIDFIPMWL